MKMMKVLLSFLLLITLIPTNMIHANDVIEIYTKQDLNNIRYNTSGHYVLMNNIIFEESDFLEGGEFYNNGKGWNPIPSFSGELDGNSYSISLLTMKNTNQKNMGFISKNNGRIHDLSFRNVKIDIAYVSSYDSFGYEDSFGVIAGINSGSIINCSVYGSIKPKTEMIGGIAGINNGSIQNCTNDAMIYSRQENQYLYAGGIAGDNRSTITNCVNNGMIDILSDNYFDYSGGIAGTNSGTIQSCKNYGTVTSDNHVGGIAGFNERRINYCYNNGTVISEIHAGGIVGRNYGYRMSGVIVKECINSGTIKTTLQEAGGLCGENYHGTFQDCLNIGRIEGNGPGVYNCYAAGLIADNCGDLLRCYNLGEVVMKNTTGRCYSGALVGYMYEGTMQYCYSAQIQEPKLLEKIDEVAKENNNGFIESKHLTNPLSYATYNFTNIWIVNENDSQFRYPKPKNAPLDYKTITISSSSSNQVVNIDEQVTISATVTSTALCKWISFISENEKIATVDSFGNITGVSSGSTVIYAVAANNQRVAIPVRVKAKEETNAKIIVSNAYGNVGDTVSVYVSLENNPGIISMLLHVDYDSSILELVSTTDYGILGESNHKNILVSPYVLSWTNDTRSSNIYSNGRLVQLNFRIKQQFTQTPIRVSFDYENYDIINKDLKKVYFNTQNGYIYKKKVTNISMFEYPYKTQYLEKEPLDITGGTLLVEYNDGSGILVDLSEALIFGYDSNIIGMQTITVQYENYTTTFEIEVKEKTAIQIEMFETPIKLTYIKGETLDISGGMLQITYDNGDIEYIELSDNMIQSYDSTKLGTQQVIVNYKGLQTQYEIEVIDILYGDVNEDGKVNQLDRLVLSRYLAKWNGYNGIHNRNSDVNQDNKVNQLDRLILARYLAKWNGYESLPKK